MSLLGGITSNKTLSYSKRWLQELEIKIFSGKVEEITLIGTLKAQKKVIRVLKSENESVNNTEILNGACSA